MPTIVKIGDEYVNLDNVTALEIGSDHVTVWFGETRHRISYYRSREIRDLLNSLAENTKKKIWELEKENEREMGCKRTEGEHDSYVGDYYP